MARSKHLPVPPRTDTDALVEAWGTRIDAPLLQLALVHRSYANEAGGIANNERLEFLGDSVLSIIIAQKLYEQYPDVPESDLSRMRAATVSQQPLAAAARRIGLGDFVFLGKGESMHGGREKDSILSDTFEALIGATYLTSGLEEARRVVLARLNFLLADAPSRGHHPGLEDPPRGVLPGRGPGRGLLRGAGGGTRPSARLYCPRVSRRALRRGRLRPGLVEEARGERGRTGCDESGSLRRSSRYTRVFALLTVSMNS